MTVLLRYFLKTSDKISSRVDCRLIITRIIGDAASSIGGMPDMNAGIISDSFASEHAIDCVKVSSKTSQLWLKTGVEDMEKDQVKA